MDYTGAIFMEAFLSVHMSFGVLWPLAKILHPEDSKKYFLRYFLTRIIVLLILDSISPYFAILDFFAVFIGAGIGVPLAQKYAIMKYADNKGITGDNLKYTIKNKIVNNHLEDNKKVIENPKESFPNVHDSKIALTKEEQEKLKEQILNRYIASGMDEQTINERIKSINEYFNEKDAGNITTAEDSKEGTTSTTNGILIDIPDLSELYPDYEENGNQNESAPFFTNNNYRTLDEFMDEYVATKIKSKTALHPKNIKQRAIARLIFSLITFLIISYICLYHENIIVCGIIEMIAFIIYRKSMNRMNLVNYIKKEIAARPDDNMDYIIGSIKQQAIYYRTSISAVFIPLTIIICCFIFFRPHIIYEKNATGYSVRYYTLAILNDSKIKIPDEYKGEKVTEIRGKTFYNMSMVKEVILPQYITEIRGNTFENSGLVKIEIPEGVTRIGGHAFYGCGKLRDVSLPYSLREIGSSAFRRCTSLTYIRVPKHTSVNEKAFKESPTRIERY